MTKGGGDQDGKYQNCLLNCQLPILLFKNRNRAGKLIIYFTKKKKARVNIHSGFGKNFFYF